MTPNRRPRSAPNDRELRLWKVGRALTLAFAAAVLVAGGVFYFLVDLLDVKEIGATAKLDAKTLFDLVKLSFGVVAGAGALVALVVAYRRQRVDEAGAHREATRLHTERFSQAVDKLGSDSPAVRLGGVHALAGLADDAPDNNLRQTCIDVLCAYLQLPYTPDPGTDPTHQEEHHHYLALRKVRHTILRLIGDHYRRPQETHRSWQGCDLDLTDITIDGSMDFSGARFSGGDVNFSGAIFSGGTVDFSGARFSSGDVNFSGAILSGGTVSFSRARFLGSEVDFSKAAFSGSTVNFNQAIFSEELPFSDGRLNFHRTTFSGGELSFNGAIFAGGSVHYGGEVNFYRATFSGTEVSFSGATFSGSKINFSGARFCGSTVVFSETTVSGSTKFSRGEVLFSGAAFSGGRVFFSGAAFSGGTVDFSGTAFSGGTVVFSSAAFSGGTVVFSDATGPAPHGLLATVGTSAPPGVVLSSAWLPPVT
ncbi:pentapeptide repeat-containing protein [Streptomyces anulatus]|uniref:pentapeptide repeat-containing protein n=1 Tax=Streptomyces anulatus TaxID=1892 RepID=UPI0034430190